MSSYLLTYSTYSINLSLVAKWYLVKSRIASKSATTGLIFEFLLVFLDISSCGVATILSPLLQQSCVWPLLLYYYSYPGASLHHHHLHYQGRTLLTWADNYSMWHFPYKRFNKTIKHLLLSILYSSWKQHLGPITKGYGDILFTIIDHVTLL